LSNTIAEDTNCESRERPDVSVIVPTFCEAENLPVLVPQIVAALASTGWRAEILIVDDDSPDDTVEVCGQLASEYPLRLEVRTGERGLSSAVIHGMNVAQGAVLLVLDADLSHPPDKIPELIQTLRQPDTDFVIGSRYVVGGDADADWGIYRWLNSRIATLLAWPLTTAKDPMAGFFAIRRATFEAARNDLDPIGYKIGLELLVKCQCRSVKEVPIHFRDRLHGESKLTWSERVNYLRHLKRLYDSKLGHLSRATQFAIVGSTGMVVDFVCFSALLLTFPLGISRGLAIWTAMSWNFFLNRRITFSNARRGSVLRQYPLFCLSCIAGALINWSLSVWLCQTYALFDQFKLLAAFLGVLAGTAFNYWLSCRVVFRDQPAPRDSSS
jgi:dolichol-phosphate mannosyltransferase